MLRGGLPPASFVRLKSRMDEKNIPSALGFILDGNRRWARENNLPQLEGHRRGLNKVKDILFWSKARGIKEVTLYAFSTENWGRSAEEIAYLMELFEELCDVLARDIKKENARMRFIGQRERFSKTLQDKMNQAEALTAEGTEATLVVALSYGGRAEILDAVNRLLIAGREQISEAELRSSMWSAGLLDPDLIIRTGGEKRLSNFLTWQSVYSELFFTDTKLPDFSESEFDSILKEYSERQRRHGK